MKKIVFIAAFMIASALSAGAQVVSFGVKAGVNINTASLDRFSDGWRLSTDNNPAGYHFGIMSRIKIPLTGFHIQPEVLLNSNTTRFVYRNLISSALNTDTRLSVRRTDLEIPILAGFKFYLFRFNLGPVFKFNISDKKTKWTANQRGGMAISKNEYTGYQVGMGLDLLSLTFDVRYSGNFNRKNLTVYNGDDLFDGIYPKYKLREGQVMFSVGYMF